MNKLSKVFVGALLVAAALGLTFELSKVKTEKYAFDISGTYKSSEMLTCRLREMLNTKRTLIINEDSWSETIELYSNQLLIDTIKISGKKTSRNVSDSEMFVRLEISSLTKNTDNTWLTDFEAIPVLFQKDSSGHLMTSSRDYICAPLSIEEFFTPKNKLNPI